MQITHLLLPALYYNFIERFLEHKPITNTDRLKKYRFTLSMKEQNSIDNSILVQMLRSSYNKDKSILMFAANTPSCLNQGVASLFKHENRHNLAGDVLIYNYSKEKGEPEISIDLPEEISAEVVK